MSIGDGLKKFAVEFGVGLATQIVRGWFNEQIKKTTPSDLHDAIKYDKDLWTATPSNIKAQGIRYKNNFGHLLKKYQDRINTEIILQWLQEDQPALFSTIINPPVGMKEDAGLIWLDKQVYKIKQKIITM